MRTFRRLNDPERYHGLSVRGWVGAAAGLAVLYVAVRVSPLPAKPTLSITVIALTLAAGVLLGLSGQAIGPGRFLLAAIRYAASRKQLTVPDQPDRRGLVLTEAPPDHSPDADPSADSIDEVLR